MERPFPLILGLALIVALIVVGLIRWRRRRTTAELMLSIAGIVALVAFVPALGCSIVMVASGH